MVELQISPVARGIVLAQGFRHLFIKAFTVTLKPWSGSVLDCPGANFGTITSRETQRGCGQGSTMGVLFTKSRTIVDEAVLPVQFCALALGRDLEPSAYSGSNS